MASSKAYLKLGEVEYNLAFLKEYPESYVLKVLVKGGHDENQVRNAWKRANGLSIRSYEEKKPVVKKEKAKVKPSED